MKMLLTIALSFLTPIIWAQTVQTPFSPAFTRTAATATTTNSLIINSNLNFFGSNGIFAGTNGVVLEDLQNSVDELRALLAQIRGSTGVQTNFFAGNGQSLSQLAQSSNGIPSVP